MAVNNSAKTWRGQFWETIKPEAVQVNPGDVHRLDNTAQTIRILSGSAWVTYDGKDIVLRKGRNMYLPATTFPALLSAFGNAPVSFEVRWR
jgi:quercetin dioxygenase-like cupin family protein